MEVELLDGSPSAPATQPASPVVSVSSSPRSDVRVIDNAAHKETHVSYDAVKSPMPGTISAVLVGPGEVVAKGQTVLVLEAMKMENDITAPRDGEIGSLFVSEGETVQGGVPLFEMA